MNLEDIYGTFFKTQKIIIDLVTSLKEYIVLTEKIL